MQNRATQIAKIAVASFVGTAIEWYDFLLYGTAAAVVFNRLFFPSFEPALGTLAALGTFAAGYLARPLGAALFGHLGDTRGRKSMLVLTLLLMGLATAVIGVLPTFNEIGVVAPVLLVIARLVQGFGLGGEWSGAVLLAYEHAPYARRGFFASWPQMGAPVGLVLANVAFLGASALPENQFISWGWRLPFLLSLVLVVVGLLVRRTVNESPAFTRARSDRRTPSQPLIEIWRRHRLGVLLGAGSRAAEVSFVTIFSTSIVAYVVQNLGLPRQAVLSSIIVGTACLPLFVLASGWLADRFGKREVYLVGAAIATLVAIPACLTIDAHHSNLLTLGIMLGVLGPGIMFGPQASFLAELFPARVRSSGLSLGFQLGGVLFGGLSPVVAAALVSLTGGLTWTGVFMLVLGFVSLASVALAELATARTVTNLAKAEVVT